VRTHPFSNNLIVLSAVVSALLAAAGCTTARYDQEQGSLPYNSRPAAYRSANTGPPTVSDAPILALIGITALGMNPGYYSKSTLGGKCVIRTTPGDPLGAPCNNIVVVLLDAASGDEIGRRPCSLAGEFSFPVQAKRSYFLKVASERYTVPAEHQGPFIQGQELLLTLTPATPTKAATP
jgi:hypothetical protein